MQIVTEPIDPRSIHEQLEQVGGRMAAAAAGENQSFKNKAERLSALRREAQRHAEAENAALEKQVHVLTNSFNASLMVARQLMEARAQWMQRAYHASRESLARRMQEMKDLRVGSAQSTMMRRRQMRQTQLDQENERHVRFEQQLAVLRQARIELRKNLLGALRTFRPWIDGWFNPRRPADPNLEIPATPEKAHAALAAQLDEGRTILERARRLPLVRLFRYLPFWAVTGVLVAVHLWIGLGDGDGGVARIVPVMLVREAIVVALWLLAGVLSLGTLRRAMVVLTNARLLETGAHQLSLARIAEVTEKMQRDKQEEGRHLSETFRESDEERKARLADGQRQLDAQMARLPRRLEKLHQRKVARLTAAHEAAVDRAREQSAARLRQFEAGQAIIKAAIEKETDDAVAACAAAWQAEVEPALARLVLLDESSGQAFPAWTPEICASWQPPEETPAAVRIGRSEVDLAVLSGGLPGDPRFALPAGRVLTTPLALAFPDQASLMIECDGAESGVATRVLHGVALRLLAAHPAGRAAFVFIDPVGLGKDFAGLMHLADYEESLINHRIWTQSTQIEERLAEINEHIEKVIQMYLRDEFPNIEEYNKHAGTIAEKHRFIVIAGFPAAFSDTAAKRLLAIASSGARCGVHLLIQRDLRQPAPDPSLDDQLRRTCINLKLQNGVFRMAGAPKGAEIVVFDPPPSHQDSIELVHRIGRASVDSNRVEVPFAQVAPSEAEVWSASTHEELRVPIGRAGAKKLQLLAIGKGTRQHVLVAGKTGSGKSTLFHVMITNLALWCSPQQVEFYLVDFKKGVEFKCYASKRLPHARVVAIESDREFALSVLQRVDAELKRRGELFRQAGAQDLTGYARSTANALPRTLLLIDEFQEFFTEDDAVAQEASLLLDRIVRQGRAFGIHVILGSQTLGGAYSLARATLGQMVVRIALQCNEADAHLIMDDDNPAPRLLTRPGEGIYNDQSGALAANSPFQIVWLSEDERDDVLDRVAVRAAGAGVMPPPPVVFEGNAPAEIRDNLLLAACLAKHPAARPSSARVWLGAPNAIKGPTEALFQRQSGSHMLVIGQSSERSLAVMTVALVALAAQYPAGQIRIVVLDPHAAEPGGAAAFRSIAGCLPHPIDIGGPAEVAGLMASLAADLGGRGATAGRDAPEVFLLVHDLQRFKALRPADEFKFSLDDDDAAVNPAQVLADVLGEGGPAGMHVIASIDTWNNVSRWIPRKMLAEFEMRVLFQMSANDSANLIDSPAAANLGLHRALFYNEHLGSLETFRPYAMPDASWWDESLAAIRAGE